MGIETTSEAWEGAGVRVLTQEGEACRYAATSMRNGIEGLSPWLLHAIRAPGTIRTATPLSQSQTPDAR